MIGACSNPAFYRLFGVTDAEATGTLIYELKDRQWDIPQFHDLLDDTLARERYVNDFQIELAVPGLGPRCISLNARRIEGADGRAAMILLAMEDITDRRAWIRHQELLVGELSHRVKNMLAVVQAIAVQTVRHSGTLEEFDEAFQGRLQALARANDAVAEGNWKGVSLRSAIERAIKPFGLGGQLLFEVDQDWNLRPQASLSLAMILHELATNAMKYGALSVPDGRVSIGWQVEPNQDEERLLFKWVENGGPCVVQPSHRGQGTRFIERSTAYELKGKATLVFEREGLCAMLDIPLKAAIMPAGDAAAALGAMP